MDTKQWISCALFALLAILALSSCKNGQQQSSSKLVRSSTRTSEQTEETTETIADDVSGETIVIACGSGCAMRYQTKRIECNATVLKVDFLVETFVDEAIVDIAKLSYHFSCDKFGKLIAVYEPGNKQDLLPELPADTREAFATFVSKHFHLRPYVSASVPAIPQSLSTQLVEPVDTLPYKRQHNTGTERWHSILLQSVSGLDDYACSDAQSLRYHPLPTRSGLDLILVPLDCGDFDYRYFLLSIKDAAVHGALYAEGLFYEPDAEQFAELTSFSINKDFQIEISTTQEGTLKKRQRYWIDVQGKFLPLP